MKVNILGTEYNLSEKKVEEDEDRKSVV